MGSILVAEDDGAVREFIARALRRDGHEVETVTDGSHALNALQTKRFDMLLTDIVMPGEMSGLDLARRASTLYPDMRIVLATGYAGDDVDAALRDAPWTLVRKPFAIDALRTVLDA